MATRRRPQPGEQALAVTGPAVRMRMTGPQRRQQLLNVAKTLLAEKGFAATSVEEIAHRAGVSKPVVYEHFGSKEAIYAVVVDREILRLLDRIGSALSDGAQPRRLIEQAARAFLDYVDECADGFRILVRDVPAASAADTYSSLLGEIAARVEHLIAAHFDRQGYSTEVAALYSHALVGMVALTGQWWLDVRRPTKEDVAAHVVNLAWNGLSHLEHDPRMSDS